MSLINDALKRARHEALRQDSERGARQYRAVPAHSRRVERPWVLFVGMGVVSGLVVAGLVTAWLAFSPAADEPAPVPIESDAGVEATAEGGSGAAAAGAPQSANGGGSNQQVTTVSSSNAPPPDARSPVRVDPEARAPAAQPPANVPPAVQPEVGQRADTGSPSSAGSSAQVAGARLEAGTTYSKRVRSANGAEIRLGGIVYSENQPIALINGLVVAPGDMVSGFTVVAIELKRVELEVDGVRFYLSQD